MEVETILLIFTFGAKIHVGLGLSFNLLSIHYVVGLQSLINFLIYKSNIHSAGPIGISIWDLMFELVQ